MINPIETWYAGCRFRSRLEARWAVAFDHLRLKWEYEAQGYHLPSGARYLPDFWLPDVNVAVEVKGDEKAFRQEAPRYAEAVNTGALPGRGLIFLGPIPDASSREPIHLAVAPHKHCCGETVLGLQIVNLDHLAEEAGRPQAQEFLGLFGGQTSHDPLRLPVLGHHGDTFSGYTGAGFMPPDWPANPTLAAAYRAGRSARFEYGEQPAPPKPDEEWPPVAQPGGGA